MSAHFSEVDVSGYTYGNMHNMEESSVGKYAWINHSSYVGGGFAVSLSCTDGADGPPDIGDLLRVPYGRVPRSHDYLSLIHI